MKSRAAVVAVGALAAVLTACGSSTSSSSSGQSGGGKPAIPSGITIGVLNTVNGAEVTQRWTDSTTTALGDIGIKTVTENGKGDPNVQNQIIASFIQQRVKGIVLCGGFATGPIAQQLRAAKDAGIPVFAVGGARVPDPQNLLTGNYAASPSDLGKALAQYLTTKFPRGTSWVYVDVPAIAAAHDVITAGQGVLQQAGWTLAGSAGFEATDFFPKTAPAAVDLFRAHPDAKVLFSCCDYVPGVTVPALQRAGFTNVLNTGTFDNLTTLKLIRDGSPVATVATNTDVSVAVAVDQLLVSITGGKVDQNADAGKYVYKVIDSTNLPPVGTYAYPPAEVINPYVTKWKSEYSGL